MKKVTVAAASAFICVASLAHAQANPRVYTPQFDKEATTSGDDLPRVQVWLDDASLRYGDIIRPYVSTDPGAYLTVVRVTTDGELRVLYPREPRNQARYRDGQFANDRLPISGDGVWYAKEGTGNGFVFAIASYYRFNYEYYSNNGYWSTARLANAGRYGSPFEIVRRFIEEVTEESTSYSMDYVMYNVSSTSYRSRYASRYRGYGYSDYLDLCFNSFGIAYYNYCRGYGYGYGLPFIVAGRPSTPSNPHTGNEKSMRIRPLIHDPVLPHGPPDHPVIEGRMPVSSPAEDAAVAKRERMLRDARPRAEPAQPMMRAEPRMEPRMMPRPEPRTDPRIEMRRADPPPPQPRIEMRAAPPPPPPPRERPQKDNRN